MVSEILAIGYTDDSPAPESPRPDEKREVVLVDVTRHSRTSELCIVGLLSRVVSRLDLLDTLNLSGCGFSSFPYSLNLLRLRHLDLSDNFLSTVPECLYTGLETLRRLNLRNNRIRSFDEEPLCLAELQVLDVSKCSLSKPPCWFLANKCTGLETFDYSYNRANDLAGGVAGRASLKTLAFKNCLLVNGSYRFFTTASNLECLNLSNDAQLNANGLFKIGAFLDGPSWSGTIRVLEFNNLGISELPAAVGSLACLEELHLEHNYLTFLPDELTNLRRLKTLRIGHNNIYVLPSRFSNLKLLERLEAQFNVLGVVDLRDMPSLMYVDLYSNDVDAIDFNSRTVQMIDLEKNYVNVGCLCDGYAAKRDLLRAEHAVSLCRVNGRKLDDNVSECSSGSSESSFHSEDCVQNHRVDSMDEESWDEPSSSWGSNVTNTNVSDSDNEYQGETEIGKRKLAKCPSYFYSCEDYLFADAD